MLLRLRLPPVDLQPHVLHLLAQRVAVIHEILLPFPPHTAGAPLLLDFFRDSRAQRRLPGRGATPNLFLRQLHRQVAVLARRELTGARSIVPGTRCVPGRGRVA